tara:strand:- start:2632 stop:3282 length:651 start_codon:yes stop_codon:yes gene_type:complete
MAFLVHNLPPVEVYVKKEYLYDHEKGHGELTPGVWISIRSIQSKALYFETLLTEYGALYDKLPISAFVWKEDYDKDNQLSLDHLQIWDCFDYDITLIKKPMLADCEFFGKDRKMHKGEYMFTLDTCHSQHSTLDINFSEHDPEHKTFNVIKLDNGQFAAQPNNRTVFTDQSLVNPDRLTPDFKVCTQNYTVENTPKWSVGHTNDWAYKSKDETLDT